jgi:hypothetical protein
MPFKDPKVRKEYDFAYYRKTRARNYIRHMLASARKHAAALRIPFTLTKEDLVLPAHCPVLGISLEKWGNRSAAPSLDRVNSSKGYVPENIRIISHRANRLKSDATIAEVRAILRYMDAHE